MTYYPPSTIAQLLFESTPAKSFPALVRDLDEALARLGGERRVTWDHDDIVFVDLNGTRVGLGFVDDPVPGLAACLTVAVGPTPGAKASVSTSAHEALCRKIAGRANDNLKPDRVLWHVCADPVTSDVVDALIDQLEPEKQQPIGPLAETGAPEPVTEDLVDRLLDSHPFPTKTAKPAEPEEPAAPPMLDAVSADAARAQILATVTPIAEAIRARAAARAAEKARLREAAMPTTVAPPKKRRANADLDRVREALYTQLEEEKPSAAQRYAAHAMNVTLTIAMPPVGAGLMAASYRHGADLRTSSRAMAATGALFGLAHAAAASELVSLLPL